MTDGTATGPEGSVSFDFAKLSPRERTQFLDALRLGLTRSSYLAT